MNYIILAAGCGTRLHPYTRNCPKSMLQLSDNCTVLQRTINIINKQDKNAKIYVVIGYKKNEIVNNIGGCKFIENPFYAVTNSIASLWFAKDFLDDEVIILNSDVVFSQDLWIQILANKQKAFVCIDSSIKKDGDYNVQVSGNQVVVMSKELKEYYGEYAGITKLDRTDARLLKNEITNLIDDGYYNEWYENALVQLILNSKMELEYFDIQDYDWAELDSVNDLLKARSIKDEKS